jgi:hypothetical protein
MSFEIPVDKLWVRLKSEIEDGTIVNENWNWPVINSIMDELEITKNWREEIYHNFFYELKYVKRQPTRNLEWVDGCHVQLYDTYLCKDCGCVIQTRNDSEEFYYPLFCPVCNPTERFNWRYDVKDGSEHYKNLLDYVMFMKELHRKRSHWFWKRYLDLGFWLGRIKYKVKHSFMYKVNSKYRTEYEARLKKLGLS